MTGMSERDIQDFLAKTELYLQEMSPGERAAALEQWRGHLVQYQRANIGADFLRIKRLLGGPRTLANLIRVQHAMPLKGSRAQSARQAVVIAMGAASIVLLTILGVLWWKFTPILNVQEDRVQVLGGVIDIDNQLGQVKVGDSFQFNEAQYKNVFEGSYEVSDEAVEDVLLEFDRGQMEISYVDSNRINWECKIASEPSEGFITQEKELVTVSMKKSGGADCAFKLPNKLKYTVNGDAGKVDVIAPANDTFIQLGSGLVVIAPDSEASYRFDLQVGQGIVDSGFRKLSHDNGIEIKVEVGTGRVQLKN